MSARLTPDDREALVAAKRRSPNSHWIEVAVEQIVARHVAAAVTEARAAALNEAAEAVKSRIARNIGGHPYADGDRALAAAVTALRNLAASPPP